MKYPGRLNDDLAACIEKYFPSTDMRVKAAHAFDTAVMQHANALLNDIPYTGMQDANVSELCKGQPAMGLELVQLFSRAVGAATHQLLTERKVDVRRLLQERVKIKSTPRAITAAKRQPMMAARARQITRDRNRI